MSYFCDIQVFTGGVRQHARMGGKLVGSGLATWRFS